LSTAESKIAPLLVSGSWVGWLMDELNSMLPSRFRYRFLERMPEDEAAEVLYNYSRFFEVPVTEESAFSLVHVSEGNPFYISSVVRSSCPGKDLTTIDGLTDVLGFETLDGQGFIKSTLMDYIARAFPKINDRNAKNIVLHLSKHSDREWTRRELLDVLKLDMSDADLEKKLKSLVKTDIISQGRSNFRYRGVNDTIFDKVFRGVYEEEIREFDPKVIRKEYNDALKKANRRYKRIQGKYNYQMGYFAEYRILDCLRFHGRERNDFFKSITRYLPDDFNFCEYSQVWKYSGSPGFKKSFSVDIFARAAGAADYSIIGEVKSRESKKFSRDEAVRFLDKFEDVKKMENIDRAVGFVFSRCGFTKEAEDFCKEKGIACSEDLRWLE
jgi:hypothetical protein